MLAVKGLSRVGGLSKTANKSSFCHRRLRTGWKVESLKEKEEEKEEEKVGVPIKLNKRSGQELAIFQYPKQNVLFTFMFLFSTFALFQIKCKLSEREN